MAALQREFDRRGWIDADQFAIAFGLARITPGTNIVAFCAATGWYLGGIAGAMVAVLTAGGLPVSTGLPAVLLYRLISLVGVVCAGWLVAAVRSCRTTEAHPGASGVARAWDPLDDVAPPARTQLQDRSGSGRLPHRTGRSLLRSM